MLDGSEPFSEATFGLGVGAALSHLGLEPQIPESEKDSFWAFMVMDNYGFTEAIYRWRRTLGKREIPNLGDRMAQRAFDHGVGRSVFFVSGGNVDIVCETIERFEVWRQPDLWHGFGLTAGHWAALDESDFRKILKRAGPFRKYVQSGVALATTLRVGTNEVSDYSDAVGRIACGASSAEIALLSSSCLPGGAEPVGANAFLQWIRLRADAFASA